MPERILHFLHSLRKAGSQTLTMQVYRKIDRKRYQFDFAIREDFEESYQKEIHQLGGNVYRIDPLKPLNIFSVEEQIMNVFREGGPYSAVHSHSDYHSGYILHAAHRFGIDRRIAHSHNTGKYTSLSIKHLIFRWVMRKWINRYASDLLAVSEPAARWLYNSNIKNDCRLKILPNAFDLDPFSNLEEDKRKQRKSCSLPINKILMGHIGRFTEQKNHLFLVKIFHEVQKFLPESRLVLIGDGKLIPLIRSKLSEHDLLEKAYFLGVRSDIPELLNALDLFLFPSLYEGLGIVLVEAQAAGVPCVASTEVPSEADLGLGMVDQVDLDADIEEWLMEIRRGVKKKKPSWENRHMALKKSGYDIDDLVREWEKLYSNLD